MKALCCVLAMFMAALMVGFSDLFLRAQGLDGVNGIDSDSWDLVGSLLLYTAFAGFVLEVFFRKSDAVLEVERQLARRVKKEDRAKPGFYGVLTRTCTLKVGGKGAALVSKEWFEDLAEEHGLLVPVVTEDPVNNTWTVRATGNAENLNRFFSTIAQRGWELAHDSTRPATVEVT